MLSEGGVAAMDQVLKWPWVFLNCEDILGQQDVFP
jgi:hypothetical protein